MKEKTSKLNTTIIIIIRILLIFFLLISAASAQFSDTFTPIFESDLSLFSDSSYEIPIEEHYTHKISLLVKNKGTHQILGNKFEFLPTEVTVDGEIAILLNKKIEINNPYEYVTLEWKDEIYDCSYMFSDLTNIVNINLTEFNFKKIKNMTCMFCDMVDLNYIIFESFDTSEVISMEKMFYNCSSLISLNLSVFDPRKVENMNFMFSKVKI